MLITSAENVKVSTHC